MRTITLAFFVGPSASAVEASVAFRFRGLSEGEHVKTVYLVVIRVWEQVLLVGLVDERGVED